MKIFYNQLTGETVGTVDGFSDAVDKMSMSIPGVVIGEFNIKIGDEHEALARRIMEPTDSLGVFDLKFDHNAKTIIPLSDHEKKTKKDKQDKAIADNLAYAKANPPVDLNAVVAELQAKVKKLEDKQKP